MLTILGIDPGSIKTGYGIIRFNGTKAEYVASGLIRLPSGPLPPRLKLIFDNVSQLIEQYQPDQMSVEEVFFARDPRAALKLGQARGAAIVAGVNAGVVVAEYSAKSIKQSVVGNGNAVKEQVQHMVKYLLKLPSTPAEDAADALAAALCHAHSLQIQAKTGGTTRYAKGRIKS